MATDQLDSGDRQFDSAFSRRTLLTKSLAAGAAVGTIDLFGSVANAFAQTADSKGLTKVPVGFANLNFENLGGMGTALGIFKKYGLEPVPTLLTTTTTLVAAVSAGSVPLGVVTTDGGIISVIKGANVELVMPITRDLPLGLMVPDSIKTVNDLRGKSLGASSPNTADAYAIIVALETYGLQLNQDYKIVVIGTPAAKLAAMQQGAISGIAVPEPNISQIKALGGYHQILDMATQVPQFRSWPQLFLMVNKDWANKHEPTLLNYMSAQLETVRTVINPKNRAQVIKTMETAYTLTPSVAASAYQHWAVKLKPWQSQGKIDYSGINTVIQSLLSLKFIPAPAPQPDNVVVPRYWNKVLTRLK